MRRFFLAGENRFARAQKETQITGKTNKFCAPGNKLPLTLCTRAGNLFSPQWPADLPGWSSFCVRACKTANRERSSTMRKLWHLRGRKMAKEVRGICHCDYTYRLCRSLSNRKSCQRQDEITRREKLSRRKLSVPWRFQRKTYCEALIPRAKKKWLFSQTNLNISTRHFSVHSTDQWKLQRMKFTRLLRSGKNSWKFKKKRLNNFVHEVLTKFPSESKKLSENVPCA